MADHDFQVTDSRIEFTGYAFSVVTDSVTMPDGSSAERNYLRHRGAVAAVAVDDHDRVALVRQYRHPVGAHLWELPAGLRDAPGEDPAVTARRELAEEADLLAADLQPLAQIHSSPGCSDEMLLIYLARGLSSVPDHQRHDRIDEEADMTLRWWGLDEAVDAVMAGQITNAGCVAGLLAAHRGREQGWKTQLRDGWWPAPGGVS